MPADAFVAQLNEQIANEFAAHQQYVACAVYYDAETLPQLARFFYRQALEERDHAMMMVQYLLDADAVVTIPGVAAPQTEFSDIVAPVALALAQERRVTEQINALAATARRENDFTSEQFMQWFIKEQVEEVATMSDLLRVVERSQDDPMEIENYMAREQSGAEAADPTAPHPAGAELSFAQELRREADAVWRAQHGHPFVRGIGDGTLDEERFRFYVRQDYLFLIDYGRLLALGAARAPRLDWMRRFAELSRSVLETEMDLHRSLASRWGIGPEELEAERAAPATRAYCDFLLRTAALGDFSELVAALLPCMWGYAEIGAALAAAGAPAHEGYAEWIATYASEEFAELGAWCRELTDAVAEDLGPAARGRMHEAFRTSSELELAFWDGAWRGGD